LTLLAVDPAGLGGVWLRGRAGPVRDRVMEGAAALPLPRRKVPATISDEQLFGGVDIAATLGAGRVMQAQGLLATPAALILPMAERCPAGLAARLASALDGGAHCLIALDEGCDDEAPPPALTDRLGLFADLDGIAWGDTEPAEDRAALLEEARARLPHVTVPDDALADLVRTATWLGIASLRAPLFALAASRASAALFGRDRVEADDLTLAVALTLAHRGAPPPEAQDNPPPPEEQPESDGPDSGEDGQDMPSELLLDAVRAALPPGLLDDLNAARAARVQRSGSGAGALRKGNRRGRPLPSRPGHPGSGARVDLVATLRAAAPWQPLRRAQATHSQTLHVRSGDLRIRRYQDRSDRLLVFAVDASGSAAMARMAEAKGAVELLLAEAYSRRDHVALVAFRGMGAEVLLPPTRSLVQTKRRLSQLPGGGGTPLAAGLRAAHQVAAQARAHGLTPALAILTDGRANITLDGTADRAQAQADAQTLARLLRTTGVPALVIDTGNRPEQTLRSLAATMDATYLALPRADAGRLSAAVSATLGD
jgi:magnesium chelatase subunit D